MKCRKRSYVNTFSPNKLCPNNYMVKFLNWSDLAKPNAISEIFLFCDKKYSMKKMFLFPIDWQQMAVEFDNLYRDKVCWY